MSTIYLSVFKRATTYISIICAWCFAFSFSASAQINVFDHQTAAALAQNLAGPGVIILNPQLTCDSNANGIFTVVNSNLGLNNGGIVLTSGQASTQNTLIGVNITNNLSASSNFASTNNNAAGDAQLTALAGQPTHDACILQFDFKPAGDTVKFKYVFGSEEYTNYTCSQFNDVFGFFISGPGYITPQNIALIPGTNIPVAVNTVNCGPTGGFDSVYCFAIIGNGYPYCPYYVDNTAGLSISYDGFTVPLLAVAAVNPCDTYHLKLGVADASDFVLDSGVFLEAGSLTSTAATLSSRGSNINGTSLPFAVRGCPAGQFIFNTPVVEAPGDSLVVKYIIGGDAVNGYDYAAIIDSSIIHSGQSSDTIVINPSLVPATGPKVVKLYILAQYQCPTDTVPRIVDSSSLIIYDSFSVHIITPDTSICIGQSVHINANTGGILDTMLRFAWTPAISLNDSTLLTPTATPDSTTTYILSTNIPGSGCPTNHNQIKISVAYPPVLSVDRLSIITCAGTPTALGVIAYPLDTPWMYLWSPAGSLNDDTSAHPYATDPAGDYTYTVSVTQNVPNCGSTDTVHVHVLPGDFTIFNHDSSICKGVSIQIYAFGSTEFTYFWSPTVGVSNPNTIDPTITPDSTTTYLVTGSYPGCIDMVHQITFEVQPNPYVYLGGNRVDCYGLPITLDPTVIPADYLHYTYSWSPGVNLNDSTTPSVIFNGDTTSLIKLIVSTQAGCTGSDSTLITVYTGPHATARLTDSVLCPNDSAQFIITNGVSYHWMPDYLVDSTSANPVVHPAGTTDYNLIVANEYGCRDTFNFHISVHPAAVFQLPDSVSLFPGESYQISPFTNCLNFAWFPPLGLNDTSIANPIAMPPVNTQYIVRASTEWGCTTVDSIKVYLNSESELAIPNAFAPGNGPNSEFKIIKKGIASLNYFRIFNRWGVKVFETTNIDEGWNGEFKGAPQPFGVYVYIIDATTSTGRKFTKQGNVTLIR